MDAFTEIISVSQKWEQRLERDYGAVGRGLHEKISSVESRLPEATVRKLRYIATIRNKATHENVALATRERRNVERTDRQLDANFSSRVSRRPRTDARTAREADDELKLALAAREVLFWLAVVALVGGYCYLRFL
jgi:hypothetical protein